MDKELARKETAIAFSDKGRYDYKVLIEIKGGFLIENNLVEAWASLREMDPGTINEEFVDAITLNQALHLGLLDFAYEYIQQKKTH